MKHSPGFLAAVERVKPNVREVGVADVLAKRASGESFHLVDVREDNEWSAGHATGSEHIGKGVIERDIEAKIPDKNASIILYCGGGFRSALAADSIQQMGYKNVLSMAGGWRAWVEAKAPTE